MFNLPCVFEQLVLSSVSGGFSCPCVHSASGFHPVFRMFAVSVFLVFVFKYNVFLCDTGFCFFGGTVLSVALFMRLPGSNKCTHILQVMALAPLPGALALLGSWLHYQGAPCARRALAPLPGSLCQPCITVNRFLVFFVSSF